MNTVVNGILTNYQVLGSKNNKNLLILHGWGRNLTDWIPVASKLSKTHKMILLDLPGFGQTQSTKKFDFDTYDYANFVKSFLKKININKTTVLGHSFGGKTSIIIAANSNFVKKLILVDPSGVEVKNIYTKSKIMFYKIAKLFSFIFPENIQSKLFSTIASSDYKNAGELSKSFKKIVNQNIESEAKKIDCDTLVIWGDKDKEVNVSNAKLLNKLISKSIVRIVWGTGHHPHLEKPEKFLEIINEFI